MRLSRAVGRLDYLPAEEWGAEGRSWGSGKSRNLTVPRRERKTETQRQRGTETQRERQTKTEKQREGQRQKDREMETETEGQERQKQKDRKTIHDFPGPPSLSFVGLTIDSMRTYLLSIGPQVTKLS